MGGVDEKNPARVGLGLGQTRLELGLQELGLCNDIGSGGNRADLSVV